MKTPTNNELTYQEMIENFKVKFPRANIKFVIDPRLTNK